MLYRLKVPSHLKIQRNHHSCMLHYVFHSVITVPITGYITICVTFCIYATVCVTVCVTVRIAICVKVYVRIIVCVTACASVIVSVTGVTACVSWHSCHSCHSTAQSVLCIFKTMCNFWLPLTDCISTAVAETAVLTKSSLYNYDCFHVLEHNFTFQNSKL